MGSLAMASLATIAVFGLLIGSFLNAAIYRLPRECMSIWKQTRSRCPRCGVQLTWYDNIPLLSYVVWLRGRCRACRGPISLRYPLVELGTALLFVGLAVHDLGEGGLADPSAAGRAWLVFGAHALVACVLIVLSLVDLDYRILPDALTKPSIVLAPVLAALVPEVMPRPLLGPYEFLGAAWTAPTTAFVNGVAGAAAGGIGLWLIGWLGSLAFRKPAMGFGDVKLMAAMGGLLGLWIPLALVLASFAGAVIGVAVLLVAKEHYVPFGPFLAIGMLLCLLWGPQLFDVLMVWLRVG
jgi:leader peptidase (prepilin peptidase) / N-methyltransferase